MLKEVQEIDQDLVEKTSNLFYPPLDMDAIYKRKDQFLNRIKADSIHVNPCLSVARNSYPLKSFPVSKWATLWDMAFLIEAIC
jgi:hypothetical protein